MSNPNPNGARRADRVGGKPKIIKAVHCENGGGSRGDFVECDVELKIGSACYESSTSGDLFQRAGVRVRCSMTLTETGESYWQLLGRLPVGFRISALEEIEYL